MQHSHDILNELKELSPLIAGMEKVNVFTVPAGYFDVLGDDILATLNEQYPGAVQKVEPDNTADVPAGYFDTLADSILHKIKAQQEESATGELRALSPMLYSIQGENVFEVPHNYFNDLSAVIVSRAISESVADELKIISPVLYGIQNKNVFEVPAGYFETLADVITVKAKPQQAKVVSMVKRTTAFTRYAVAAVFTCIATLGILKLADSNRHATTTPGLASLDPAIKKGQEIASQKTFDQELAKITDAEIVSYLKENGDGLDIAAITSGIDEKELPSQDDYLVDEKALDNYLNGITEADLKN